jgi:hypothetical protein
VEQTSFGFPISRIGRSQRRDRRGFSPHSHLAISETFPKPVTAIKLFKERLTYNFLLHNAEKVKQKNKIFGLGKKNKARRKIKRLLTGKGKWFYNYDLIVFFTKERGRYGF